MNQKQQIERGDLKNDSYSDTTNRERCPQEHLWFRHYKQREVSSKTTLNQTLQIERGVLKKPPLFRHYKQREVSSKTSLNQTQQIERGVLKYYPELDTTNRERGVLKNISESHTTHRERCH